MSGHSKWAQIKRKKALTDAKKGKEFGRLARAIQLAAQKGKDPTMNPVLRLAIREARAANMPSANIERVIKAASSATKENALETLLYEAYGPGGVALLIEVITDNKNRSVAELKHLLQKKGSSLAETGAVRWMFSDVQIFRLPKALFYEELEEAALYGGAEDVRDEDTAWAVTTRPSEASGVEEELTRRGWKIEEVKREWKAKNVRELSQQQAAQLEELLALLSEHDDVQEVYTNAI